MLTLWIVVIVLGVLELFETVLLVLLLRALGEMRQQGISPSASTVHHQDMGGLAVGEKAPSFVATNQEGKLVSLEDFEGQRRILAFISPGCPACASAISIFNAILKDGGDFTILVIGGPDRELNRSYAAKHRLQVPLLTPQSNFDQEEYLVPMIPFVFVLDETGIIRARGPVIDRPHMHNLLATITVPATREHARS